VYDKTVGRTRRMRAADRTPVNTTTRAVHRSTGAGSWFASREMAFDRPASGWISGKTACDIESLPAPGERSKDKPSTRRAIRPRRLSPHTRFVALVVVRLDWTPQDGVLDRVGGFPFG